MIAVSRQTGYVGGDRARQRRTCSVVSTAHQKPADAKRENEMIITMNGHIVDLTPDEANLYIEKLDAYIDKLQDVVRFQNEMIIHLEETVRMQEYYAESRGGEREKYTDLQQFTQTVLVNHGIIKIADKDVFPWEVEEE